MARHLFTSVDSFVWHLAVNGIARGYFFYVTGWIPEGKDPLKVDAKLMERYGVTDSKWVRYRRRQRGEANVRYLRLGLFFVLIATEGTHPFFELETTIEDFRITALRFHGLRIGAWQDRKGGWHPSVKLGPRRLERLIETLLDAEEQSVATLVSRVPGQRFKPVQWQVKKALRSRDRSTGC